MSLFDITERSNSVQVGKPKLDGNDVPEQDFKLQGLRTQFGTSRTSDDVHTSIKLCPLMRCIMNTPHMQRLRGLKQLGISEMTYISTTHNRFEHSVGVAHLSQLVCVEIAKRQPKLGITEKDIVCVKLAGLLHDIGHGPFSHLYDGQFRKQLIRAETEGRWLGRKFTQNYCTETIPTGWEHEDGSLMMIDALLAHLGLKIVDHNDDDDDDDDTNLDAPLEQIGHGINARCFGIYDFVLDQDDSQCHDGESPLPDHLVLTSRDWIFIKECIIGGPLPPKGMSIREGKKLDKVQKLVGRPDEYKEFLYDIVSNRHSGLDVDKVDYFARDGRRAFGQAGQIDSILAIENAHVAWGRCSNPSKCFRCKHFINRKYNLSMDSDNEENHLMICYPEKMVKNAMIFFKTRFDNHHTLYTHPTTVAAGYMICDILLLADPFIKLSTECENDDDDDDDSTKNNVPENYTKAPFLPISRANLHPESYLRLKDSILDVIEITSSQDLKPARQLLKRFRARDLYKKVASEQIISSDGKIIDDAWQRELWDMDDLEICTQIVKCGRAPKDSTVTLKEDDIIIEKLAIHHGMGAENPVSRMRFLPKTQLSKLREAPENLPLAEEVSEKQYESTMPRSFLQRTFRLYCRNSSDETCDHLKTCFYQFKEYLKKRSTNNGFDNAFDNGFGNAFDESNNESRINVLSQSPARASNDSFGVSNHSFMANRSSNAEPRQKRPRRSFKKLLDDHLGTP